MNIIIAGASRGIGLEMVKRFVLSADHKVVAISRNTEPLENLRDACIKLNPASVLFPMSFDLEKDDYDHEFISTIKNNLGTVDILIYNAGLLINKPFAELTDHDFQRQFNVNVKGAFQIVQSLLGLFSTQSHILNISSMGGFQGSAKFPGLSLYSASKGALAVLTECLAEEFKNLQIKCNCLALGAVQTEMLAEAFPGYEAPLSPQKMSEFIVNFAVQGHNYFNGKILPVSLSTP